MLVKIDMGAIRKHDRRKFPAVAFSRVRYDLFSPNGCSPAWLLSICGGIWLAIVNSWWHLDGCCPFLVASRWLPLIPGAPQFVARVLLKEIFTTNAQVAPL